MVEGKPEARAARLAAMAKLVRADLRSR
jgi:hypothetical protein